MTAKEIVELQQKCQTLLNGGKKPEQPNYSPHLHINNRLPTNQPTNFLVSSNIK